MEELFFLDPVSHSGVQNGTGKQGGAICHGSEYLSLVNNGAIS